MPWLDWGVLVRLDGAGPGLCSLRGGEAVGWEVGLGGEAGGGGRVARLRGGGVGVSSANAPRGVSARARR